MRSDGRMKLKEGKTLINYLMECVNHVNLVFDFLEQPRQDESRNILKRSTRVLCGVLLSIWMEILYEALIRVSDWIIDSA